MKLSGVFDKFKDLDQIPMDDILKWINPVPNRIVLENYLASRIFFPQTVATSQQDLKWDLAILREALKRNADFASYISKKIFIPEDFLTRFPNLSALIWAFVDAIKPKDIWTVLLKGAKFDTLGSVIVPSSKGKVEVEIAVDGKTQKVAPDNLMFIPCSKHRCQISFKVKNGQILGKDAGMVEIFGGRAGVIVDTRI